ncbi:MAG: glycosyltransferase [Acidimicrobiales bacterium]
MRDVVMVHERFTELGGSEKVVREFGEIWPDGTIFAPIADESVTDLLFPGRSVSVSPLQRLYRNDGRYAHLLPLLPAAVGSVDLSGAELVVVSHHAFGHRIKAPEGVPVLSYVHSPARWMWDPDLQELEMGSSASKWALTTFAASQRAADRRAAGRVTRMIANSTIVAERIQNYWGLEADVIHPPVDTDFYTPDHRVQREDFFLLAGRMVPYKRPQVAVAAAAAAGVPLVVAGHGRAMDACRAEAGPNVTFIGEVSDEDLRDLYRRCRALVFPGVEDFGIVPVEAQACGAPVIGVARGGLRDSIIHEVTGLLVPHQTDAAMQAAILADAISAYDDFQFDSSTIRFHAESFGRDVFRKAIETVASRLLS